MAQYRRQVQPTQYISQYDPLLNQRIEQDLAQRDKAFKQTYAGMAEEQARQGDIFFLDAKTKGELAKGFEQKKQSILEKYNGEYDKAAPELTNLVVQEHNNPLYQLNALQIKKKDEVNKLKVAYGPDMLVHKDVPNSITRDGTPISPEELDYDVEKRSNYDKIIMEGSKGIVGNVNQEGLSTATKGYLKSVTNVGVNNLDAEGIKKYAKAMGEVLDNTTTFSRDINFGNSRNNPNAGKTGEQYILENYKRLLPGATKINYKWDRQAELEEKKRLEVEKNKPMPGVVGSYGLVTNPKALIPDNLVKENVSINISYKNTYKKGLTPIKNYRKAYRDNKISEKAYYSGIVEQNLRKDNSKIKDLFEKASKTNKEILKESGLTDRKNLEGLAYSNEHDQNIAYGNSTGNTHKAIGLVMERKKAIDNYNNMLKEEIPKYINEHGLNLDAGLPFYQPDLAQKGVSAKVANFNKGIAMGTTRPGQFTFLDDDYAKLSSDEINKKYGKDNKFEVISVSGNELQPLVWKVKKADGTISNATWNTGYQKQLSYIENINYNKGLIESLNASVLGNDKDGKIQVTMPDAPFEIEKGIKDYDLYFEPDETSNANYQYLKSNQGYLYINEQGKVKYSSTKIQSYPKGLIFDIIKALGK